MSGRDHRGGPRRDTPRRHAPRRTTADEVDTIRPRVLAVGAILAVMAMLPLWKLVEVQGGDGAELVAQGKAQRIHEFEVKPRRGSILDRTGTELAISLPRRSIGIEMPILIDEGIDTPADREWFARHLAELLELDADRLVERFVGISDDAKWFQVALAVEPEIAERALEQLAEEGIHGAVVAQESFERVHPAGDSALRILGTLSPDGIPKKNAGIEKAWNEALSGREGEGVVETGRAGNTVPGTERITAEAVDGSDVQLTLDLTLQHEVEQILLRRATEADAQTAVAIVGRPSTGELLAIASVERDDAAAPLGLSMGPTAFAGTFQAGSVFKIVTIAAALEAGIVDADTSLVVEDRMQIDEWEFKDHHEHPTEPMTVTRILAESSNVGTIKIAQQLGKQDLRQALVDFGFGRRTGVGHPAEDAGILPPVDQWSASDLAASAIGTHQSGTALQLWSAYNVVANGGRYVVPRLVDSVIDPDGRRHPEPSQPTRRVISEQTAATLGSMLEEVVTDGTGSQWRLPGYAVAAKTGTSRMVDENGSYVWDDQRGHYVAAFTGYFPANRPEVAITVILSDVPEGMTGSSAAGPVFSDLAKLSIRELGIAPSHLVGAAAGFADGAVRYRAAPAAAPVTTPTSASAGRDSDGEGDDPEGDGGTR